MEGVFIAELWDGLAPEAQGAIGMAAIAMVCAKVLARDADFAPIANETFRKAAAELRQHVEDAGALGKFPACWSSISDEEREAL